MLQARSQVRKLQKERSKNADELLKSLQEAALSFTKDATATMTPAEVNEAIGTANEVLETMFPTFTAQHEGAQREIEHAIGVVQGCHDMHGGDESVRLQLAVARAEVANDECQQALDETVANEHEVCAGQEDDPNCLCDEARQAATAETALCAVVSENHQAVYCDNYHSCTSFAECHARETEAYGLLRADIEGAMQTRQQQYRTYMQSNCILNLITAAMTAGTPIPPASLVACSDVDLDDLTLTFPNPPEGPAQCPAGEDCHLDEPPAISGAISHGSMVHIRNQYGPRHYLDTCGHNSCSGAGQFNVVASPSRTRGAGTGTWEMIKTSGSGAISHGDHVHIRNQAGTKNYLDACDHASCGGGYNVIAHLEVNRHNVETGTWEIVRETGEEGPLVHGDVVHLQNQYNDKTWLDACGHASCGGGYEVSTHAVRNRGNHRTGSWEILLVDPYVGCFVDDGSRDLDHGPGGEGGVGYTFATCNAACQGYSFMSLQWGGQCFCGDAYGTASQYAEVPGECTQIRQPCSDASHSCGGAWRNAVYRVSGVSD